MNLKLNILVLFFSVFLKSCLSPSDKQHSCDCEYEDQTENLIRGINNFSDLKSGEECDKKCEFKKILILFYNESDSSRKILDIIESNPTLVNNINNNFAFVCLSTEKSTENLDIQMKKYNNSQQPFFVVMTSLNDSLITSFGYMDESAKIDSILISTLY